MKERDSPTTKIGEGHLAAFGRQGLRELRSAIYPESNVAQQTPEYGLYGTRTPGEIAESRRSDGADRDEEQPSVLADHLRQAEARADRGREDMEPER